jgi:hypothetical protein
VENVLNSIGGVGVFGIISICLFFAVFVGVLLWTLCLKKPYLKAMRELPLEDPSAPESNADLTAKLENQPQHD